MAGEKLKAVGPALVLLFVGCVETTQETRATVKFDAFDQKCAEIAHDCAVCQSWIDENGENQTQSCKPCEVYDFIGCGDRPGHKTKTR